MFPSQQEVDFSNPREHFVWALRGLAWGPQVAVIPKMILEAWSEHLVNTGAVHRDYLLSLADENGKIDVSDLPEQQIKYQAPVGAQDSAFNAEGKWVPVDTPEPDPLPTTTEQLDYQAKAALAAELKEQGFFDES